MTTALEQSRRFVERLAVAAAAAGRPLAFMEVCGTHTMSAFRCGLHALMPPNVRLVSGPGCPVCVTSQGEVDRMISLARRQRVTLCTYGDMLRVTGTDGESLESARGDGADVRIVYSSLDAVEIATEQPRREVVFVGVGFETTAPATAAAVLDAERRGLTNFSVLTSHKRIMPAMVALLDSGEAQIDGFLCPGHVAVIIGAMPFGRITKRYARGCAVVGFEDFQIAEGLAVLTEMACARRPKLVNLYPQVVTMWGNHFARNVIRTVFAPGEAAWRGLGVLPLSGLELRRRFKRLDAVLRFDLPPVGDPRDVPGCRCGEVICGRCVPADCALFAKGCTPIHPIGPCMVSSEGTCQAWFKYGRNRPFAASRCSASEEV